MTRALLTAPHARWLESETDRLLGFALGSYRAAGGFGVLDENGRIDADSPLDLLITCRMTHVFSVAHLLGRGGGGLLADHGVAALDSLFRDRVHGGWVREVDARTGLPTSGRKEAYAHAFVLLAASSAAAAGRPGADRLLEDAAKIVAERFWDQAEGRSRESWDAGFTGDEGYRGANSNMHSVEAYLAAADATGDPVWRQRALQIAGWLINDVARANSWRIVEHFHADGSQDREYNANDVAHQYRPYGATIGHSFEWSRLLLHLGGALGGEAPAWLLEAAQGLYTTAMREGWAVDGSDGFVYTVDWSGRPLVRARLHWVIAEAIGASAALHAVTGDPQYAEWYRRLWDHAAVYFFDRPKGSWHHELDATNHPSSTVWSGKPDVYHALQTTLIPRLPLSPALSFALRDGALDAVIGPQQQD